MSAAWPALIGLLSGAVLMAAFRRFCDTRGLRTAVNRIQACLLEFWLYVDEPMVAIRTWKDLLAAQARLFRLLLVPTLVASAATAPVLYFLEGFYGRAPLATGSPALVTARLSPGSPSPTLIAPQGVTVETPPVRVGSRHEVSWRIRPARELSAHLIVRSGHHAVRKSIVAGTGIHWVSPGRTGMGLDFLLPRGPVAWIEVRYPPAAVTLFGLSSHWAIWFSAFSLAGALLLRR